MEQHLDQLGLYTVADIANYSVESLKRKFGVLGEELWYHTHGIDSSLIKDKALLRRKPKSYVVSQVLFKDYNKSEIPVIIQEMVDDVTRRVRLSKKRCRTVTLSICYSKDYQGGFSRQTTLDQLTSSTSIIYRNCLELFDMYYEDLPIRTVGVSLSKLDESTTYQYSLFEDAEALDKEYELEAAMDKTKHRFGKNAVLRSSSEVEHSTVKARNKQIGGHHV